MQELGKTLLVLGMVLAAIGAVLLLASKSGIRGLPGDIHYQSPHVRIYFPIVTCIVLSVLLTLALWLWRWLNNR